MRVLLQIKSLSFIELTEFSFIIIQYIQSNNKVQVRMVIHLEKWWLKSWKRKVIIQLMEKFSIKGVIRDSGHHFAMPNQRNVGKDSEK